ncbi:Uncharacterised protein r2_g560 [Pycnogonum litorale]
MILFVPLMILLASVGRNGAVVREALFEAILTRTGMETVEEANDVTKMACALSALNNASVLGFQFRPEGDSLLGSCHLVSKININSYVSKETYMMKRVKLNLKGARVATEEHPVNNSEAALDGIYADDVKDCAVVSKLSSHDAPFLQIKLERIHIIASVIANVPDITYFTNVLSYSWNR